MNLEYVRCLSTAYHVANHSTRDMWVYRHKRYSAKCTKDGDLRAERDCDFGNSTSSTSTTVKPWSIMGVVGTDAQ